MESKYKFKVYPLSEEDGGGFYAEVPELPGCIASAETLEETMSLLQEAIESWIKVSKEKGKTVPEPTYYNMNDSLPSGRFGVRISRSSHNKLLEIAKKENISLNALVCKFLDQMIAADGIDTIVVEKLLKSEMFMDSVSSEQKAWELDESDKIPYFSKKEKEIYVIGGGKSA